MSVCHETELWTMPGFRAAWTHAVGGFTAAIPVSGERLLAAVGSVSTGRLAADEDLCRDAMRSVLADLATLEGHDATTLLHRANVELGRLGFGRIDTLAFVLRSGAGIAASVSGAGSPVPLVVTRDHLTAPARDGTPLDDGWAVVLGSELAEAGPFSGLLSPEDVRRAIALLADVGHGPTVGPARTMLAVTVVAGR
jgi:hypothetical protein